MYATKSGLDPRKPACFYRLVFKKEFMLTKAEKLEAYTYALFCAYEIMDCKTLSEYLEADGVYKGVCINLEFYRDYKLRPTLFILKDFPEFAVQRPKRVACFWWKQPWENMSSHLQRIAAIERAIELTEKLPA